MRGIAFTGGEGPGRKALRKIALGADVLAAADSGLALCEDAGLRPDWVVGDMDSLDDLSRLEKYPPDRVIRFPAGKDFTDTELAVNVLREKGCDEVWIAGGGGGRLDHLFAIRSLFERADPPHRWFPGKEEIRCVREGGVLRTALPPGSLVGVFPLGCGPWQAESSGLRWPLNGLVWERGSAWVSNVATQGPFEIHAARGRLLVLMRGGGRVTGICP
ncbi:MAG: thiamine diphosphokinase [Treponema sp.]|nr:thiamine diphosphokinase [Treponema sp.]